MRSPAGMLVAIAATVTLGAGLAAGNSAAFGVRAAALESKLNAVQRGGVPAVQVDLVRTRLVEKRAQRLGPIPYGALSGALFADPLGAMEQQTQQLWDEQTAATRALAVDALGRLEMTQDEQSSAYQLARAAALDRAQTPDEYRRLAGTFDHDAALAGTQAAADLEALSGGLVAGRPADVEAAAADLAAKADQARSEGLATDPAPETLDEVTRYLLLPAGLEVAEHDAVKGDILAASVQLTARLTARDHAAALLSQASDLLAQLEDLGGSAGDYPDRLAQAQAALAAASADVPLAAATAQAEALLTDLQAELARYGLPAALTAGATCISGAPPKLIVVHLATESLIAYENGCPVVQTLVTTGRPGLRTDRGDFYIFSKSSPYKFVSPWPPGSPFWYHSAWVAWAMEIVGDGTYLHDAPWQPAGTFGPGSENGPYASHGCIHVPTDVMQMLFQWAPIGTEVLVGS